MMDVREVGGNYSIILSQYVNLLLKLNLKYVVYNTQVAIKFQNMLLYRVEY